MLSTLMNHMDNFYWLAILCMGFFSAVSAGHHLKLGNAGEALFALPIALFAASNYDGYFYWGVLLFSLAFSVLAFKLSHVTFYSFDTGTLVDRRSWYIKLLAKAFKPEEFGKLKYCWVAMTIKGTLVGLPALASGHVQFLLLGLCFSVGHYIGNRKIRNIYIEQRLTYLSGVPQTIKHHMLERDIFSAWLRGLFAGIVLFLTMVVCL